MAFWLLERTDKRQYDQTRAMVVRADSEQEARNAAELSEVHEEDWMMSDERGEAIIYKMKLAAKVWQDPNATTCQIVPERGPAGVVLSYFRHG